jgi:hypothetical protein
MTNKNSSKTHRALVVSAASLLLMAVGFAAGGVVFYRIDETFTTKRFVEDRLSQCTNTTRISELSDADNEELQGLLESDLRQCKRLIEIYSFKLDNDNSRDRARRLASRLVSMGID